MIVLGESWKPSDFYDNKNKLIWIFSFPIYKKIVENKVKAKQGELFAIRKDIKKAFDELYKLKYPLTRKNKNMKYINNKKTRKHK